MHNVLCHLERLPVKILSPDVGPFEFSELQAIINKLFLIESLLQVFYYSNKKWTNTMSIQVYFILLGG